MRLQTQILVFFGQSYRDLDLQKVEVVNFNLEKNNGRAIVMAEDHGVISLYGDKETKQLIGGEIFMPHAEHFTHLLAWAVEQEMTVFRVNKNAILSPSIRRGDSIGTISTLQSLIFRG